MNVVTRVREGICGGAEPELRGRGHGGQDADRLSFPRAAQRRHAAKVLGDVILVRPVACGPVRLNPLHEATSQGGRQSCRHRVDERSTDQAQGVAQEPATTERSAKPRPIGGDDPLRRGARDVNVRQRDLIELVRLADVRSDFFVGSDEFARRPGGPP